MLMNDTLYCNLCCFSKNLKKNFCGFNPKRTHINTKKINVQGFILAVILQALQKKHVPYKTSYLFYCITKCQKGQQKINPKPTLGVPHA
jgi:hypothetical protein